MTKWKDKMITLFNRREILFTYSIEKFAKARDILNANKIRYTCSMHLIKTFGNQSQQAETHVYVNKKDYEYANYLIAQAERERY